MFGDDRAVARFDTYALLKKALSIQPNNPRIRATANPDPVRRSTLYGGL